MPQVRPRRGIGLVGMPLDDVYPVTEHHPALLSLPCPTRLPCPTPLLLIDGQMHSTRRRNVHGSIVVPLRKGYHQQIQEEYG